MLDAKLNAWVQRLVLRAHMNSILITKHDITYREVDKNFSTFLQLISI